MKIGGKTSTVKSISRAASVLNCISEGQNSLTEIAESCGLSKSTVHRLLTTLVECGIVVQDPVSRKYFVGKLITKLLSRPLVTHEFLIVCAEKEMVRLSEITRETISLGIMLGLKYISLKEIPSRYQLRVVEAETDMQGPLHAGAGGKVLLSQLNDQELQVALDNLDLKAITPFTITDKQRAFEQIRQIREQGYAESTDEVVMGAMCIAVPVKGYSLPTCLSIIGPTHRMQEKKLKYRRALQESAAHIARRITRIFGK